MVSIPGQITGMDDAVKVQEMVSESLKKTYKGSKSSSSWTLTNDHHTSPQFDYPIQLLTYIFHSIFPHHFKQSPLFEIKYLKKCLSILTLGRSLLPASCLTSPRKNSKTSTFTARRTAAPIRTTQRPCPRLSAFRPETGILQKSHQIASRAPST